MSEESEKKLFLGEAKRSVAGGAYLRRPTAVVGLVFPGNCRWLTFYRVVLSAVPGGRYPVRFHCCEFLAEFIYEETKSSHISFGLVAALYLYEFCASVWKFTCE